MLAVLAVAALSSPPIHSSGTGTPLSIEYGEVGRAFTVAVASIEEAVAVTWASTVACMKASSTRASTVASMSGVGVRPEIAVAVTCASTVASINASATRASTVASISGVGDVIDMTVAAILASTVAGMFCVGVGSKVGLASARACIVGSISVVREQAVSRNIRTTMSKIEAFSVRILRKTGFISNVQPLHDTLHAANCSDVVALKG